MRSAILRSADRQLRVLGTRATASRSNPLSVFYFVAVRSVGSNCQALRSSRSDTTAQAYRLWAPLTRLAFLPRYSEPRVRITSNSIAIWAPTEPATKVLFEFTNKLLRGPRQ
jgi:hypothetical protein